MWQQKIVEKLSYYLIYFVIIAPHKEDLNKLDE